MRKKIFIQNVLQFILVFVGIVLINYISSSFFFRLDLTTEKRFTLKPITKEILSSLNEVVYVDIYLDGDLPPGFQKMKEAIREQLNEYRVYAGNNLQYQFNNLSSVQNEKKREELFRDLVKRGLSPVNLQQSTADGEQSQKIIFPGVIFRYKDFEMPVNLLKNNKNFSSEQNINSSIETLEYEFILALKNIMVEHSEKIAFLEGHGELNEYEVGDITKELARFFQVDRGVITTVGCLNDYKALIIASPKTRFSEKDKFVIDQYIMQGGKVLWFLDNVLVDMDSLAMGSTVALTADLNLDDQLFKYGVRPNPVLVKDLQCNLIPIAATITGGQSRFAPVPWVYYPLFSPPQNNMITRGVDLVKSEFAGMMDTLQNSPEIKKYVLLASSEYSMAVPAPLIISLDEAQKKIDQRLYSRINMPVAVLLEGSFESVFSNRIITQYVDSVGYVFKSKSVPTKLFVAMDGDLIRNNVKVTPRGPMISPLGFDRYTQQTFGNKDFIMNVIHYLTDEVGLMELRGREFKLRLLDRNRIQKDKLFWILFNTLIPVLTVVCIGVIISFLRKNKYSKINL